MPAFAELNRLSSQELHDRAFRHAEHHIDLKFFWDLVEMIPIAEVAADKVGNAEEDVHDPRLQVLDAIRESPELMDALRPVYIDYLMKHPDA